jgi:hypothetical protein
MSTPQLGLTALSIVSPNIPAGVSTLSVDTSSLALVINADLNTIEVLVSIDVLRTSARR